MRRHVHHAAPNENAEVASTPSHITAGDGPSHLSMFVVQP